MFKVARSSIRVVSLDSLMSSTGFKTRTTATASTARMAITTRSSMRVKLSKGVLPCLSRAVSRGACRRVKEAFLLLEEDRCDRREGIMDVIQVYKGEGMEGRRKRGNKLLKYFCNTIRINNICFYSCAKFKSSTY